MEKNNYKILIQRIEQAIQRKALKHAHFIAKSAHQYRHGRKTRSPYLTILLRYEQLLNKLLNSNLVISFIENCDLGKLCRQYVKQPENEQEIFALLMPCAICKESLYQEEIVGCLANQCLSFTHTACLARAGAHRCPVCRSQAPLAVAAPHYILSCLQNFILVEQIFVNQTAQCYFIKSIAINKETNIRGRPDTIYISIKLNSDYHHYDFYQHFIASLPQLSYKKYTFSLSVKASSVRRALEILGDVLTKACRSISPYIYPAQVIVHQRIFLFNNQPLLNKLYLHLNALAQAREDL